MSPPAWSSPGWPRRSCTAPGGCSAHGPHDAPQGRRMSLKEAYTVGARALASRSMTGLARTRLTPNMLTAAGVTLCVVGGVLVYFEYRNELVFFWLGAA